jgi:hypothetical protein
MTRIDDTEILRVVTNVVGRSQVVVGIRNP